MHNNCPIPVKELALMVSAAFIDYLFRKNGDNVYIHPAAKIEIERIALSLFLESYYCSIEFNEVERQIIYTSYLDLKNINSKYDLSIGLTINLNQDGITSLNELMDDYILIMTSNTPKEQQVYH